MEPSQSGGTRLKKPTYYKIMSAGKQESERTPDDVQAFGAEQNIVPVDTAENRLQQFVTLSYKIFGQTAETIIKAGREKDHVDVSSAGEILGSVAGGAASVTAALAESIPAIGKPISNIVKKSTDGTLKKIMHNKAKKIALFLICFDKDDEAWMDLITSALTDIFIHFNLQFNQMLESTTNWDNLMFKLGKDVCHRIFSGLGNMKENCKMDKSLLIQAFLKGNSHGMVLNDGGQIVCDDATYFTKDLFEEALVRKEEKLIAKKNWKREDKHQHLYRWAFPHEENQSIEEMAGEGCVVYDINDLSSNDNPMRGVYLNDIFIELNEKRSKFKKTIFDILLPDTKKIVKFQLEEKAELEQKLNMVWKDKMQLEEENLREKKKAQKEAQRNGVFLKNMGEFITQVGIATIANKNLANPIANLCSGLNEYMVDDEYITGDNYMVEDNHMAGQRGESHGGQDKREEEGVPSGPHCYHDPKQSRI